MLCDMFIILQVFFVQTFVFQNDGKNSILQDLLEY